MKHLKNNFIIDFGELIQLLKQYFHLLLYIY